MTESRPARRPFRLLDAMVLTAALAAALALQRWTWRDFTETGGWKSMPFSIGPAPEPPVWVQVKDAIVLGVLVAWAYVSVLAPTLLLLGLIPPRPPRARLMRQAGALACIALLLVVVYRVLGSITEEIPAVFEDGYELDTIAIVTAVLYHPWDSGLAVAAAWLPPALAGCLRFEPTWIDRAGRFMGCYALACVPLLWILGW